MTSAPTERDLSREAVFAKLVDGMLAMRADLHIDLLPDEASIAAVWSWANRSLESSDELEQSLLMNVLEDQMWVDWQDGAIVFRLTPIGITHVENMAGGSDRASIESYMVEMGLRVPSTEPKPES